MVNTSNKITPHYGVFWNSDGVAWLLQGRGGTNAIGLKGRNPFQVRLPSGRVHCNHQIPLEVRVPNDYHWDYFLETLKDPLVKAMLPVPKAEPTATYVNDDHKQLLLHLVALSRMSSPIYQCVLPIWKLNKANAIRELECTNVQPLVLMDIEAKHSTMVQDIASASMYNPRKLVLVGANDVVLGPTSKRIQTTVASHPIEEFTAIPWEIIGATIVRKFMRGEINPIDEGSYGTPKTQQRERNAS